MCLHKQIVLSQRGLQFDISHILTRPRPQQSRQAVLASHGKQVGIDRRTCSIPAGRKIV
jgi:hypothetical protein